MNITILYASPKSEGLAASCLEALQAGISKTGANADLISLCSLNIERCAVCGDGWGDCREVHTCSIDDDFADITERISAADALVFITPVYWGETTEVLKSLMDRLRRCQAFRRGENIFAGKHALLIASPGGSGNGALTCLSQMERFCQHVGLKVFDFFSVNRWNRDYKLEAIKSAGQAIASGREHGISI